LQLVLESRLTQVNIQEQCDIVVVQTKEVLVSSRQPLAQLCVITGFVMQFFKGDLHTGLERKMTTIL